MGDIPPQRAKILYFVTKSNWGGAQRHVFDLATNLSRKEFEPIVALGGEGPLKGRLEEVGVRTVALRELGRDMNARKDAVSLGALYAILKKEAPGVLHAHSPKAGGLGAVAGRAYNLVHRKKIRIIYTAHGWTFNENRNIASKALIMLFSWLTIVLSHKVIVLGEREYEQVRKWPWVKDRIAVIANGIAKPPLLARSRAREFFATATGREIRKNTLVLGTVGELNQNKGHRYMIEALAELKNTLPDFIFILMGEGEDRQKLQALIASKGLEKQVFLLGYVHNASLYLKGLDIFTLVSVKEGLPYAIIEAGRAQLPIIASDVGNIPDLIDDMRSGILIKPKNTREIAESIRFLIHHPEKRLEFAENAYKKMNAEYSLSKMLEETIKLYR